jgi:hypothetical protein
MSQARTALLGCAALILAVAPAQAAPPAGMAALTKTAAKASGLKPTRKVPVVRLSASALQARATLVLDRDYPPDQQAYDERLYRALGLLRADEPLRPHLLARTRGLRGLYDPAARTLYLRSTGNVRAAALRGLVHALEDQAFDLRRTMPNRRGQRDAALAATAAVEGATSLFLRAPAPRRRPSPKTRIASFLELERDFHRASGLRFASTLKEVGGRRAVHDALRRLPATTEQVFHVDAFLTGDAAAPLGLPAEAADARLEREDSFGELDLRALLAVFGVPRPDRAAEGWAAGRSALYRDAVGDESVALVQQFDTVPDALEWRDAVHAFVQKAFAPGADGAAATRPCDAETCWTIDAGIAFSRVGTRTALAFAATTQRAAALARALAAHR